MSHATTEELLDSELGVALTVEARGALASVASPLGGLPGTQTYCGLLFPAEEEGEGEREPG